MERFERSSLLLGFIESLRDAGSWAGETHVQKAGYFLQDLLGVPLGCEFILYKHGPFSFDLREEMGAMHAAGFVVWEPKPYPYGPSLKPGPLAEALRSQFPEPPQEFAPQIEFTARKLGDKRVVELERLGTALYVTLEDADSPAKTRAERISELKPHISPELALDAVEELDGIRAAAADVTLS